LQAPHREPVRGEVRFARDADQFPRHPRDARLRDLARPLQRRAIGDERVAASRRGRQHFGLHPSYETLHLVCDPVE
jgi:hypothetical protein